ncbi:glycosyltransferase family 39 protein [Streptomyces anulatus]|uniref:glycosyltransferase family 39 protein n=1 Tax=Streptomyces anulatus TaxID=1892 RepID=UPI0004C8607B|nr:glycosyltransferase family 39 protein [Streptomyces anulatus]
MPNIRRNQHRGLVGMLLIAVAFAGLQLTAITGRASPDTKNYLSYALSLSGESRQDAGRLAIGYSCASGQQAPLHSIPWTSRKAAGESEEQCVRRLNDSVAYWTRHGNTSGMTAPFANQRFMAIFEARPGYPLFLVPFLAAFGPTWGLWLAGLAAALAGSVCVLLTLRIAGASRRAGLAGQALYLALPTGTVAMNPLSDGLCLALGTAVVLGCTLLLRDRPRAGAALVAGGLALMFLVRYSQALLLAAALAGVLLLRSGWLRRKRRQPTPVLRAAGLCGVLAALIYAGAHLLSWPMGEDSAQDLLTHHYQRPDRPDPWPEFFVQERVFWTAWLRRQATYPVLPVLLGLSAWALLRRRSVVLPVALAAGAAGLLNQAGHPNLDQLLGHRLIVFVWLLPALAIPLLLDRPAGPASGRGPSPHVAQPKNVRSGQRDGAVRVAQQLPEQ